MATTTVELERFIVTELTQGTGIATLDADDDLLGLGIVDSHGIVELVAYLEERFGIAIGDDELTPENFSSIACIERFVERKGAPC